MKEIKAGNYRHYKGNLYEVVGEAKHTETLEDYVVYKALYGDCNYWLRPKEMFLEKVIVKGMEVPRFEYLGSGE